MAALQIRVKILNIGLTLFVVHKKCDGKALDNFKGGGYNNCK